MRVLLIQKEVKRCFKGVSLSGCLRVLLIQKEVKQKGYNDYAIYCLRVLLIQKEVKQSDRFQTVRLPFESLVNTEGSKTETCLYWTIRAFESLVNTEGSKTYYRTMIQEFSLRVLLIQKEVKQRTRLHHTA